MSGDNLSGGRVLLVLLPRLPQSPSSLVSCSSSHPSLLDLDSLRSCSTRLSMEAMPTQNLLWSLQMLLKGGGKDDDIIQSIFYLTVLFCVFKFLGDQVKTQDLEKMCKKKTALQLHYVTLAEYHKVQRIPRGLRVSLRPTLFSDKDDFCDKFEAILNKCSLDRILLTVDYLHKEIPAIDIEIGNIEQQLCSTLSHDEFTKIKTQTDKTINEFQSQLQERKRLKFIRDTDDYQRGEVYHWTNRNSESTNTRTSRRWNSSFSSDSGSDGSRSSVRPYDQRRGRNSRIRGNRRYPAGSESTSTRMQTHSQVSSELRLYLGIPHTPLSPASFFLVPPYRLLP
ncbi:unnamed protein product [Ranitomeya imitator]|uniref:Uncharacterized protein n=1 Tax=Ranitomeya imitator TaxID=111125 RepID=A0ABN9KRV2_9NEOB|nr:unnamed protein product [Ranitomeya imitator]